MSTLFYQGYNENTLQGNEFTVDAGTVTYDTENNAAYIDDPELPITLEITGLTESNGVLDLRGFTNLVEVESVNNRIAILDISGCDQINFLNFPDNDLTNTDAITNSLNATLTNGYMNISGNNNLKLTSESLAHRYLLMESAWRLDFNP